MNGLPRCGNIGVAIAAPLPRSVNWFKIKKPGRILAMKCNKLVDVGRRQFLRGGAISAVGAAAATMLAPAQAQAQSLAMVSYPANRLANLADLKPNEPMDIAYPDADSPGVLI